MKLIALILLMASSACFALDADEIEALAKKPHDRKGLSEEMRFFPEVREYAAELRIGMPGEDVVKIKDIVVKEKTVEGKYIISELHHPDAPNGKIVMVVGYDKKEGVYRKWVALADGGVSEAIGSVVPKTKSISWFPLTKVEGLRSFGNEHHTDDLVRWKEVMVNEAGKVVSIQRGMAKKVK